MARTHMVNCRYLTGYASLKTFTICTLFALRTAYSFAQPIWIASPTVTETHSTSIDVSYTLDQNSTVYYFGLNYNYAGTFTSAEVKSFAIAGPSGQRVCAGSITYSSPGTSASLSFTNFLSNTSVTLFMVAESDPGGVLQVTSIKNSASTTPCVPPNYLSAFSQSEECVNKGASATYDITLLSMEPDINGVISGTTWVLDWGDGTPASNYTSVADNDIPPVGLRTHTYTSVTSCNYLFSISVTSPCGSMFNSKHVAVVHGRDLAADGDGLLALVDNSTGNPSITVCAGTQSEITIRDNSTWNCQNPTVEEPYVAIPNNDQRNIEWLYGRDPSGAIMNTITGTVTISALGSAPATSSRITPTPYGPSSLSEVITIPATCQPGEYFRVYLKNWNKCNWLDPEAIATFIDITVANSPLAPTISNVTICGSTSQTLTVTSPVTGLLKWYSDALKTTLVYTGGIGENTYTPSLPIPSITTFYVAEIQTTGSLCEGPAAPVTITIINPISNNTISAPQTICANTVPAGLTGTLPTGGNGSYIYLWESSTTGSGGPWTASAGANSNQNYTPPIALTQDTWYRRVVTSGPCSDNGISNLITVNPLPTAIISGSTSVCRNDASPNITFTGGSGTIPYTFTYKINGGSDQFVTTTVGNSVTVPVSTNTVGTFTYSLVSVMDASSAACSQLQSGSAVVTVNPLPTAIISGTITVCKDAAFPNITFTGASGTTPYTFTYNINGGGNQTVTTTAGNSVTVPVSTNTAGTFTYSLVSVQDASSTFCSQAQVGNAVITVNPSPGTSAITGNQTPACNALGEIYSVVLTAGSNYTWDVPAGAVITAGATGPNNNSITVNFGTNSGNISVIETLPTSCSGTQINFPVSLLGCGLMADFSASSISICNGSSVTFTNLSTGTTGSTTYSWDFGANASPANITGAGPHVVAYTGTGTSTVSLTITDGSTNNKTIPDYITVNPLPATSPISGDAIICQNATNKVYSVTNHPGSSYYWTVPSSLSVTSPTNLNFLVVDAVPGQSQTGDKITVAETITSTGCTGPMIEFPIEVSEIFPPETVAGPNLECQGASGLTYSVPNHSGSSYSWTVPSGANITSDPGLNAITVGFPISVSGNITVSETNGACITNHIPLAVTINPLPVPTVSGPQSLRISATDINYSTEASMNNYSWTISPGGVITSGTGSNNITVTWNNVGNQSLGISYKNANNCTNINPAIQNINIYPLPSVDNVHITGSLSVGSVLTGNYNYNDRGTGTEGTSTYRWIRDGSTVVGTGISYTIDNADLNKNLVFEVTPVSTMGIPYSGLPVSSPSVSIENLLEIPVASEVCIEGTRAAGNILRGKYKFTHSRPEGNSTYQWYNGITPISSATNIQYTLTPQDITDNSEIIFKVTPVSSNSVPVTGSTVSSTSMVMLTLPQSEYSVAINEVELTASPSGGIYAGTFVMNGIFSPKQAGTGGPFTVQYFYNIINTTVSCFQQASKQLMVIPNSTLFSGFDSVYCKQGSTDVITVSGAPPAAVSHGFTLSDPDAILSQTEWTVTIDPSKMNAGIKKDILTFHYNYGGYDYYITHPFKVDSVGSVSQIVNLNPAYCSNSPKQNIYVSGVYPSGGTGLWTGSVLSDITATSASIDPSLGTSGMTYPLTYQYTSPLGCKSNLLSYNVSVNQSPESLSISTSDPLQLCLGESATLSVTNTPGYNYQWKRGGVSVGSNLNTYEAVSSGNYSVVVSNSSGCTANSLNSIDILDVNSQMTTTFRLSGPTSFCQGNSLIMSVSDNPAYTFQWIKNGTNIDQATTNSLTVTNSGIYSLVVMNSGGCKNKTEDINVNVSALPEALIINAGGPVQFCQTDSVILSVTNIPGYIYRWRLNEIPAGTNLNSFTAKNSGTYSLVTTNSAGCSANSLNTINVTVNPNPTASVSLNGPESFCQGSSVLLSVQKDSTNSYQWMRNGSVIEDGRTNSYAAKDQGTYSLIITSTPGCIHRTGDVTLNVHEAPAAPTISAVGPLELCLGDSTTLSVPATDGYFYQWKRNGQPTGSGLTSIVAKNAGTYTLVVSNSAGCSVNATNSIDLADVNSQVTTTFKVSGPTSFCNGGSIDLSVNNNPEYKYQWVKDGANISGATTNFYSTRDSGVYYLNVTNSNGCKNKTEEVNIVVYSTPSTPLISSEGPLQNCQGDSVILSVTNIPGYSYQWKLNGGAVGADSSQFSAKSSGTYTLSVANKMGCSASSANSVAVTVNPLPAIGTISQIGNDTKFCRGESITLSVPLNENYFYSWNNKTSVIEGETTNIFIARESGEYTVEVTTESGCKKTPDPIRIEVVEMPAMPSIDPGGYYPDICLGENPLRLSVKDIAEGYNYKWFKNGTPYSISKYIDIQEGGNYYLEANIDICTSARDSLVVKSMKTLPKPDITANGTSVWYLSTTSKANYYKWYYNGSVISDADKQMYVAHQNLGIYRVGISDDTQCFSLSDTIRIPTDITGIENNDTFENIKIFPNPTTGLITIEINNNIYGELEIEILSINGLKIRNIKSDKISDYFIREIDLTDYSSGMYIINLSVGKYFATRKIILR